MTARPCPKDLTDPRPTAVTDNEFKGDKSPGSWKPPLTGYYRTYARMWLRVKYVRALTVTSAERSSLGGMLATC